MNYEDEAYVRLYKRKTATFKRLGWEGRTVLWHLFLEADKAGIIDVGDDEVDAVCVLTDLPEDVVKLGLSRLASHGVTERHGTSLVITRFIEAQEAKRSDVARSRDYRERRRAEARHSVTPRDETTTQRDEPSRPVTTVTKRHSQQSSADQIRSEQSSAAVDPRPDRLEPDPEPSAAAAEGPKDLSDSDALSLCPADLAERAEKVGMFGDIIGKFPSLSIEQLRHEAERYTLHFTFGAEAGKRGNRWMSRLRGQLVEKAKAGTLKAPGAIEHELRTGRFERRAEPEPFDAMAALKRAQAKVANGKR